MNLIPEITEKDRLDYIKTQIWRIIYLPFSPQGYAFGMYWVDQIYNKSVRKKYFNLLKDWFYGKLEFKKEMEEREA